MLVTLPVASEDNPVASTALITPFSIVILTIAPFDKSEVILNLLTELANVCSKSLPLESLILIASPLLNSVERCKDPVKTALGDMASIFIAYSP